MTKLYTTVAPILYLMLFACGTKEKHPTKEVSALSHNVVETPDYATVFPDDKVQRIDIKLDSIEWNKIEADLAANTKEMPGGHPPMHKDGPPPTMDGENPFPHQKPEDMEGTKGMDGMGPMHNAPMPGMNMGSETNPIWVPCEISFNDEIWSHVGIRVKGNSSLQNTYRSGRKKFSFKLDFDQFEDSFPSTKNQRFYGFKQLNLNNNFDDPSLMREKVAADLFRTFGLVAARASFYEVYMDYGTGKSEFFGIYTLLEEMDDSPIKAQLSNKKGNLYKPENRSATFAKDYFEEDDMKKKNNKSENDYSDVKKLHTVLNSTERTTAPDQWNLDLEGVFNVDIFVKWLAVNTTIQNWDSYGHSAHNYYLYNNPADSLLTWIPWDHNESLQKGKGQGALTVSLEMQGDKWPIIEYLMAVPEYRELYNSYLNLFTKEVFSVQKMTALYTQYADLLKPFALKEKEGELNINGGDYFVTAVQALKVHVQERNETVHTYLKQKSALVSNLK